MSKKITIPFQEEWRDKMLDGIKTCSSRTKKYGNSGDWFEIFGSNFRLISINKFTLEWIANNFYLREGCDSSNEFKKIWVELHPKNGWVPSQVVFTHFFRREV